MGMSQNGSTVYEIAPPELPKQHKLLHAVGYVTILLAVILLTLFGYHEWQEFTKWDPLGDYPIQTVSSETKVLDTSQSISGAVNTSPSFTVDDFVYITGIKCVVGDRPVNVRGELSWVSDHPPGIVTGTVRGGGQREPGCTERTFANPIPEDVKDEVQRLAEKGITTTTWHLTGTEIPYRENGETGVPRTWVSTSFEIRADNG